MRKNYLLTLSLIAGSALLSHAQVQKSKTETEVLTNEFYVLPFDLNSNIEDISANGKYATGSSLNGAFLWDIENTTSDDIDIQYLGEGSSGNAVSDNGVVAIDMLSHSETHTSAGVWENGNAYSLGLGLLTQEDVDAGIANTLGGLSGTHAITADGKIIVGQSPSKEYGGQTPYSWTKSERGEWEELSWHTPNNMLIRITGISSDGSVACGNQSSLRSAIIWTSPSEGKILDESVLSQAHNISSNGKYIALRYNNHPAIYNTEEDRITILDEKRYGTCLDVSDNGIAVGFYTNQVIGNDYKAFVWSEEFGFLDLTNYIATFANDVVIPDEIDFKPASTYVKEVRSISADGKVIGGYHWGIVGSASSMRAWVLKINNPIDVYAKPENLSIRINYPDRNKVVLTWDIPNGTDLFEVTGYKIYRNGNELEELTSSDINTYTDENVPNGKYEYEIAAVYENGKQSPKTDAISIYVYSTEEMELPYIDNFEESLNSYYWNADSSYDALWHIDYINLTGFKGFALNCRIEGNATDYSSSVVSRPFDATSLDRVYLSYLFRVSATISDIEFLDIFYVDILDETNPTADWITINTLSIDPQKYIWENFETDISQYAAGKVFRIRLRAEGVGSNLSYILVDNLQIRPTTGGAAPKKLVAQHTGGNVHLSWQDPTGTYKLTYSDLQPYQKIGDEQGKTIIGANKYEIADLLPYKGLLINSISTYFPTGILASTNYKIVIFEGETKIIEEDIYYEATGYWMTIPLRNPLTITAEQPLYIGIEASNYFNGEETVWPLYTDMSVNQYDGKGNLYSEDDGKTWKKLSESGLTHNWCIVANVKEESSYEEVENIWGYYVYRNGIRITETIIATQSFLDETAEGESNDYAVRAYYNDLGWSDLSEELTVAIKLNSIERNDLVIYPNPANEEFYIQGLEGNTNVSIFDVSGRLLQKQSIKENESVSVNALSSGMYMVRIHQKDKTYEKVLIKK